VSLLLVVMADRQTDSAQLLVGLLTVNPPAWLNMGRSVCRRAASRGSGQSLAGQGGRLW